MAMKALTDRILIEIGIKPERFSLKWASAAEAPRFVRLITDFTMEIKKLGPLGAAEGLAADELKERIDKGLRAVTDQKLRMSYGNAAKAVRKDAEWTMEHISGIINEKMEKTFQSIFHAPVK